MRLFAAIPAPLPSEFRQGNLAPLKNGEGALAILTSSIDRSSAEFAANAERMHALVAELAARRAEAALGGSQKSRERHVGARQAVFRASG